MALASGVLLLASCVAGLAARPKDLSLIFKETIASHQANSYAATPIKKQRVAVCGAGGKAGSMVFGALQRAAQTWDAGLAPPRALVGAARGSRALNSCLGSSFVLAFAGEDLVKLTDFRDEAKIGAALAGCGTVVVPSKMRPQGAVTGTEWSWDVDMGGDADVFSRVVAAASEAGVHVVAVAPPGAAADVEKTLDEAGAAFTLLVVGDLALTRNWNLNKGIQQVVRVGAGNDAAGELQCEDLASVVTQVVVCLDPTASRVASLAGSSEGYDDQEALTRAINAGLMALS